MVFPHTVRDEVNMVNDCKTPFSSKGIRRREIAFFSHHVRMVDPVILNRTGTRKDGQFTRYFGDCCSAAESKNPCMLVGVQTRISGFFRWMVYELERRKREKEKSTKIDINGAHISTCHLWWRTSSLFFFLFFLPFLLPQTERKVETITWCAGGLF